MTFVATVLFGLGFIMLVSAIDGSSIGDALSSILSGTYNGQVPAGGGKVTHQ